MSFVDRLNFWIFGRRGRLLSALDGLAETRAKVNELVSAGEELQRQLAQEQQRGIALDDELVRLRQHVAELEQRSHAEAVATINEFRKQAVALERRIAKLSEQQVSILSAYRGPLPKPLPTLPTSEPETFEPMPAVSTEPAPRRPDTSSIQVATPKESKPLEEMPTPLGLNWSKRPDW